VSEPASLVGLNVETQPAAGVPELDAAHLDLAVFPADWGLMVPHGKDQLRVVKQAAQLEAKPIDRPFLAAILRRAAEHVVPRSSIQDEVRRAREAGREAGAAEARSQIRWNAEVHDRLKRSVEAFEAASGIRISDYNGGQLGEALALFMRLRSARNGRGTQLRWEIQSARDAMADLAQRMTAALDSGMFE
jgi:hypothetical protein